MTEKGEKNSLVRFDLLSYNARGCHEKEIRKCGTLKSKEMPQLLLLYFSNQNKIQQINIMNVTYCSTPDTLETIQSDTLETIHMAWLAKWLAHQTRMQIAPGWSPIGGKRNLLSRGS